MTSLILPRSAGWPRAGEVRISTFARQLGCRTLLLPTAAGWADAGGLLYKTGGSGSIETVPVGGVLARRASNAAAWSDFLQDRGYLDPTGGYWWLMRARLISSLGNWGGIIARTSDNSTTSGWAWQRSQSDLLTVFHGNTQYSSALAFSLLLDGLDHTLLGLWRPAENRLELWVDGELRTSYSSMSTVPPYTAGQGQIKILASRDTANLVGSASFAAVGVGNLSAGAAAAISGDVGLLFARRRQVLYFDSGGATTRTLNSSLSAAVRQSRLATSDISAALLSARSGNASFDASLRINRDATPSADAAILGGARRITSLTAAVRQAFAVGADIDAAIMLARDASASLDAYLSAGGLAAASIDSAIRSSRASHATLDAFLQSGSTASAGLDAAIRVAYAASASLDAAVSTQHAATATADASIRHGRSLTAALDAFLIAPDETHVTSSLSAAVRAARAAIAGLDAALAIARNASASADAVLTVRHAVHADLDAWIQGASTATASLDAAINQARLASANLNAFIQTADMLGTPEEVFRVARRQRLFEVSAVRRIFRI